mmetsp:Transcript_43296/g.137696  ORF Transcript_43296/g.137696 Transcript_43296/m.137696 type:complete len:210 (+) Transcript_43296:149-778(+)
MGPVGVRMREFGVTGFCGLPEFGLALMSGRETVPSDLASRRPGGGPSRRSREVSALALRLLSSCCAKFRNMYCTPTSWVRFASILAWYVLRMTSILQSSLQAPQHLSRMACSMWYLERSMAFMPLSLFLLAKAESLLFWPLMMASISASRFASSHASFQPFQVIWTRPESVAPDIFSRTFLAPSDLVLLNSAICFSAASTRSSISLFFW